MTLDTRDDRTLFFDLLPIFFRAANFSFRIKVYTVPGQPVHEATRKVVLANSDGVVFVADSAREQVDANRGAWGNLTANLAALNLAAIPVVVQYNKRDLPDAVSLAEADRFGDPSRTLHEASARAKVGVLPTFFALVERTWQSLDKDLKLVERLGIDGAAFRGALAEHVGVTPDRISG
ncbi:MAG TPA: GTPase domain-containing protein [Kofleriaceae bacterium]